MPIDAGQKQIHGQPIETHAQSGNKGEDRGIVLDFGEGEQESKGRQQNAVEMAHHIAAQSFFKGIEDPLQPPVHPGGIAESVDIEAIGVCDQQRLVPEGRDLQACQGDQNNEQWEKKGGQDTENGSIPAQAG